MGGNEEYLKLQQNLKEFGYELRSVDDDPITIRDIEMDVILGPFESLSEVRGFYKAVNWLCDTKKEIASMRKEYNEYLAEVAKVRDES